MRRLWVWTLVTSVSGWSLFPTNDLFFSKARQEIDYLHRSLVLPDSHQIASDKVQETSLSKGRASSKTEEEDGESLSGAKISHGKSKEDKTESGHKGSSKNEKISKTYGEHGRRRQNTNSKSGTQRNENIRHSGAKGGFFEDKLLYKSGNYEKGYRDKYHLDEEKKHNKFWKNGHSLDKYLKYGKNGSRFHKVMQRKGKKSDKKELEKKGEKGKKQKSAGGSSSSDHKGHQSKQGKASQYEHKEEYNKKIP